MQRIKQLTTKKNNKEKIVCITAYDYTFARLIDDVGLDLILVGDSAANVCAGHKTTLPITLDEMIYHSKAVRRAVDNTLLIADLPFLSYQVSLEQAINSAGRLMKEAYVDGVKLEGGKIMAETIYRLTHIGIPVMGHIGFTPQSVNQLSGYSIQGKKQDEANRIKKEASIIEEAGAFSIVLELAPTALAKEISSSLNIPVIGIGAGPYCDGQILVSYDLLGMNSSFSPKFLRKYANLDKSIKDAINHYKEDVQNSNYPSIEESY